MEKTTKIKKAPPKKEIIEKQIPFKGKIYDVHPDGSTTPAVSGVAITPEQTGKIDLHLQTPEAIEETIKKEVAKLNDGFHVILFDPEQNKKTPREKIALLKEMIVGKPDETGEVIGGMTINGENDEEGYKKLDNVRKMLVKLRTGVGSKHKLLKENYLKVSKALDGEKNALVDLIEEIEHDAEAKLKVIDDAKAKKEREEKEAKERKRDARVLEIKANGMDHVAGFYTIGETINVDIVTLENLDDEQYSKFLGRVKTVKADIDFKARKAEQRRRVDAYLLQRQKRKQDAEALRLENEKKEQRKERTESRLELLEGLGFVPYKDNIFEYKTNVGGVVLLRFDVENLEGDAWREKIKGIKAEIADLKVKQDEKDKEVKKEVENQRREKLMFDAGYLLDKSNGFYYLLSDELGQTNKWGQVEIFEIGNFDAWFNEVARADAENHKERVKKLQDEKKAKDERTQNRIREISTGLGMLYTDGIYYRRPSMYRAEPEMADLSAAMDLLRADVEELDEQQWTGKINELTVVLSKVQQAEESAKNRKASESEKARQLVLNDHERVNEYITALEQIKAPEAVPDALLAAIVNTLDVQLKAARDRLTALQDR